VSRATMPVDGFGESSFTFSNLNVGMHTITATYNGDANFNTSNSLPRTIAITPGDIVNPTATLTSAPNVTLHNNPAPDYTITVTYADSAGIDFSTLGDSDIYVTGPNGFDEAAFFVSRNGNTATYRIPGFTATENGTYTIAMTGIKVKDTAGNRSIRALGARHPARHGVAARGRHAADRLSARLRYTP